MSESSRWRGRVRRIPGRLLMLVHCALGGQSASGDLACSRRARPVSAAGIVTFYAPPPCCPMGLTTVGGHLFCFRDGPLGPLCAVLLPTRRDGSQDAASGGCSISGAPLLIYVYWAGRLSGNPRTIPCLMSRTNAVRLLGYIAMAAPIWENTIRLVMHARGESATIPPMASIPVTRRLCDLRASRGAGWPGIVVPVCRATP